MRFFFFNGKAAEGPFDVDELVKRPDFTPESLVAPAGSAAVDDWKPAISYEVLKEKLLGPAEPPPPAEPPEPMKPCPKCSQVIPEVSGYCNRCGEPVSPGAVEARQAVPQTSNPWSLPKGRKALIAVSLTGILGLILGFIIPHGPSGTPPPETTVPAAKPPPLKSPEPKKGPKKITKKPAPQKSTSPAKARKTAKPRKKKRPRPKSRRKYTPKSRKAVKTPKKTLTLPGVGRKVAPLKPRRRQRTREPKTAAEKLRVESALEEFRYCQLLMKQGSIEDVFDFCLCTVVKHGPPNFGNRDAYVLKTKKELAREGDSRYELDSTLVRGPDVMISGIWTRSTPEGGLLQEPETQRWVFEEGKWCASR